MPVLREGGIHDPRLEKMSADERRAYLGARLAGVVAHAYGHAPRARRALDAARVHPSEVRGLDDLARLPVTRKDDLPGFQAEEPPFGGLAGAPPEQLARIFMSPGPIFDPQGLGEDFWRFRHGLAAAGFRRGDIALVSASYHLTPLGFMLDNGARALGCAVIPGGVGQTELQARVASTVGATAYIGTPSFCLTLLQKAREQGTPLRLEVAWVIAEMLPESLRAELETSFGVRVLQGYGTADLGCLAYECVEKGGWHLHPECVIEVLDIETGAPASPGQPGEVVATIFDEAYPLLRFGTGDITTLAPGERCACGRTTPKLAGLLGRVGDAVKVKGMFVRGAQVEAVAKRFGVERVQAVVTREAHQDRLEVVVEVRDPGAAGDLPARLAEALREEIKVRAEVEVVSVGTLPPGAKRIEDRRVWK